MDRVFVITVCRNAEKLIEPTMLSVLNQTYGNLDYIVIDGASTDGTTDIIRRYGDRLSYWVSEPDGGIYDAMNKGVQMAQSMVREGETAWVNFMNAGDGFSDNEVVEDFFVDKEGCPPYPEQAKVLIGNFQRTRYSGSGAGSEESEVVKTGNIDFLPAWMPFCHQAVFMKLDDCHFDTRYKIAADYHLFYNLYFKDGKSAFYVKDRVVAKFSMDDSTTYSNLRATKREILDIQSKRKNWFWWKEYIKWCLHKS